MSARIDAIVIGAGLAGLRCAQLLQQNGASCTVLEQSDAVGGRIRTDRVDGFLLDRGFQVLLTAYPTARELFDYDELDLCTFDPGALVFTGDRLHRVGDPLRRPGSLAGTLAAPVGSMADKLRMLRLRHAVSSGSLDELFARPERTTLEVLRDRWGFSDRMIERFFRPFIGGVTFDPTLRTSSRFFEFVMRMFSAGSAAVPARGMQELPEQLARRLEPGTIELGVSVASAEPGRAVMDDGSVRESRVVVIATGAAAALVDHSEEAFSTVSTTSLYFVADRSPVDAPMLVLDGDRSGPVTNVAVLSDVSPEYSPDDRALICASVPGDAEHDDVRLEARVRAQLGQWFGRAVRDWSLLRVYRIPHALPDQTPPALAVAEREVKLADRLYLCGDHLDHGSIEGALRSGTRAAAAILADA